MYISLNNKNYEIRLNKKGSPIYIKDFRNNTYVLSVPMDLREKELIQYLQTNEKILIRKYKKNCNIESILQINLYNILFIPKLDLATSISYRKDKYIYSSISTKSTVNTKKICREILFQDIKQLVGFWEEQLNFILDNISLKNYKSHFFKICPKENSIHFSTKLINYHFPYIEFIVAISVFKILKINELRQLELKKKFVIDYKQSEKIFDYERGVRI